MKCVNVYMRVRLRWRRVLIKPTLFLWLTDERWKQRILCSLKTFLCFTLVNGESVDFACFSVDHTWFSWLVCICLHKCACVYMCLPSIARYPCTRCEWCDDIMILHFAVLFDSGWKSAIKTRTYDNIVCPRRIEYESWMHCDGYASRASSLFVEADNLSHVHFNQRNLSQQWTILLAAHSGDSLALAIVAHYTQNTRCAFDVRASSMCVLIY